jgi:hypothetical protein
MTLAAYLQSIGSPVADEKLPPFTINVPTFDPMRNNFTPEWIKDLNTNTADQINKICNSIQFFTDEAQQLKQAEREQFILNPVSETEPMDIDQVEADARGEPEEEKLSASSNALQWVKEAVLLCNPWTILENSLSEMTKSASCAQAIIFLFEDAEITRKAHEGSFAEQMKQNIRSMAIRVCEACDAAQSRVENASGSRMADVYRTYAPVLRWIARQGFYPRAALDLRELASEQSLPFSELDNPDWVNAYTGEVDLKITERVQITIPEKEQDQLEQASLTSSEGFDSEDDLDNMYNDDLMTIAGEWDVREPTWMEIQEDLKPSENITELKLDPVFKTARKIMRDKFQEYLDKGLCKVAAREIQEVSLTFHEPIKMTDPYTGEVKNGRTPAEMVISRLNELAETQAIPDIAYIFLSFQNGYLLREEEADQIKIQGSLPTLGAWLEIFGDEILDNLNEGSMFNPEAKYANIDFMNESEHYQATYFAKATIDNIVAGVQADVDAIKAKDPKTQVRKSEAFTSPTFKRAFDQQVIDEIVARVAAENQAIKASNGRINAYQSPEFVRAFLNNMGTSSSTVFKDTDGKFRSIPNKAGWEAWLSKFSPVAFEKYLAARKDGKSFDEAKGAFWAATKTSKKLDTVASVKPSGLILGSGREISWGIAIMKVKANEIDFQDKRLRLKDLLVAKGWAPNLVALL